MIKNRLMNENIQLTSWSKPLRRRWRSRRLKFVVFINSNRNIPSATESFRDGDKVASTKLYKLWRPFWVCFHLPFQQVTCLFCIKLQLVLPWRAGPSFFFTHPIHKTNKQFMSWLSRQRKKAQIEKKRAYLGQHLMFSSARRDSGGFFSTTILRFGLESAAMEDGTDRER